MSQNLFPQQILSDSKISIYVKKDKIRKVENIYSTTSLPAFNHNGSFDSTYGLLYKGCCRSPEGKITTTKPPLLNALALTAARLQEGPTD